MVLLSQVEFVDSVGYPELSAVQADKQSSYVGESTVFNGFAGEVRDGLFQRRQGGGGRATKGGVVEAVPCPSAGWAVRRGLAAPWCFRRRSCTLRSERTRGAFPLGVCFPSLPEREPASACASLLCFPGYRSRSFVRPLAPGLR